MSEPRPEMTIDRRKAKRIVLRTRAKRMAGLGQLARLDVSRDVIRANRDVGRDSLGI